MSRNRFKTPRAYVDLVSYNLANGFRDLDNITTIQDDNSTAVTFDAGSEASMFDMKPANFASIANTNKAFYIQFDFGEFAGSSDPTTDALSETNFLAILGHNFKTSEAMFKVELDDDTNMSSPTQVSLAANHSKIINADDNATGGSNMFIKAPKNGWTLIHWTQAVDNRFLRITFKDYDGASQNFAADVNIGSIMFGKYIDFKAPNLDLTTSVNYDGTNINRSVGGNSYANSTFFGEPVWSHTLPWNLSDATNQQTFLSNRRYGRVRHSLNFDLFSDETLFAPNWFADHDTPADWYDSDSLHSSFYNRILGQHLPFLFTIDSTSTTTGDYGMFRLANPSFEAQQVAHQFYNIGFEIEESW
tara:strand:- start:1003 stop:2082 length:1080 start_codon:yes stop_codon:yes gene_type:complete